MSVIEAALRRAQMQQKNAPPHAVINEVAGERIVSEAGQRGATASQWRRVFSPAMIILVVLAVATIAVIGQPGWGEGFQRWYSEPATAPVNSVVPAPAAAIITAEPITTGPITSGPIIGPEVDLSDVLAPKESVSPVPAPATIAATPVHSRTDVAATAESAASILSRFQLGGVMMTGSKRLAIVNGAVVEKGQRVGGAVVTAITRRDVTLTVEGKAYRIPLRGRGN